MRSSGSDENAAGSVPAGAHGPLKSAALSQLPLFSQYQVLLLSSTNTSQLVFTATLKGVPGTGASTGSPSKTSRLAARWLTKICGGASCSATDGGVSVPWRRLSSSMSSGTRLAASVASAALMRCSNCAAWAVSADGKCERSSFGWLRVTWRVARSVDVAKLTSTLPSTDFAPVGVSAIAMRVFNVCRSGHEMTCGW